jgi:hypothetical protein
VGPTDDIQYSFLPDELPPEITELLSPSHVMTGFALAALVGLLLLGWTDMRQSARLFRRRLRAAQLQQTDLSIPGVKKDVLEADGVDMNAQVLQLLDEKEKQKMQIGMGSVSNVSPHKVVPMSDSLEQPSALSLGGVSAVAEAVNGVRLRPTSVSVALKVRRVEELFNALCPPLLRPLQDLFSPNSSASSCAHSGSAGGSYIVGLGLLVTRRLLATHSLLSLCHLSLRRCGKMVTRVVDMLWALCFQRRSLNIYQQHDSKATRSKPKHEKLDKYDDDGPDSDLDDPDIPETRDRSASQAGATNEFGPSREKNETDSDRRTVGFYLLSLRSLRLLTLLLTLLCGSIVTLRILLGRSNSCDTSDTQTQASCENVSSVLVPHLALCRWEAASYSCVSRDFLQMYRGGTYEENEDVLLSQSEVARIVFVCSLCIACIAAVVDMIVAQCAALVSHSVSHIQYLNIRRTLFLRQKLREENQRRAALRIRKQQLHQQQQHLRSEQQTLPLQPYQFQQSTASPDTYAKKSLLAASSVASGMHSSAVQRQETKPPRRLISGSASGGGFDFDELRAVQSQPSQLLRAVRLAQLQRLCEEQSALEEAVCLTRMLRLVSRHRDTHRRDTATPHRQLNVRLAGTRHWFESQRWDELFPWLGASQRHSAATQGVKALATLRRDTLQLVSHCDTLLMRHSSTLSPSAATTAAADGEEVQEIELLRNFVCDMFPKHGLALLPEHWLVTQHVSPSFHAATSDTPQWFVWLLGLQRHRDTSRHNSSSGYGGVQRDTLYLYVCIVLLLLFWLGGVAALVWVSWTMSQEVSSEAQSLWQRLFVLLVIERFCVTELCVATLSTCIADVFVARDAQRLLLLLMQRCRVVLSRRRGVVLCRSLTAQHESLHPHDAGHHHHPADPFDDAHSVGGMSRHSGSVFSAPSGMSGNNASRHTGSSSNVDHRGPVSCVVQHVSVACRAARHLPHLPVSRLLFSLNDTDLDTVFARTDTPFLRLRRLLRIATAWLCVAPLYAPGGVSVCFSAWLGIAVSRGVAVSIAVIVLWLTTHGDGENAVSFTAFCVSVACLGTVALLLCLTAWVSASAHPSQTVARTMQAAADKDLLVAQKVHRKHIMVLQQQQQQSLHRRFSISRIFRAAFPFSASFAVSPSKSNAVAAAGASAGVDEGTEQLQLTLSHTPGYGFGSNQRMKTKRRQRNRDMFSELDDDLASYIGSVDLGSSFHVAAVDVRKSPSYSMATPSTGQDKLPWKLAASRALDDSFAEGDEQDDDVEPIDGVGSHYNSLPADERDTAVMLLGSRGDRHALSFLNTLRDRVTATCFVDGRGAAPAVWKEAAMNEADDEVDDDYEGVVYCVGTQLVLVPSRDKALLSVRHARHTPFSSDTRRVCRAQVLCPLLQHLLWRASSARASVPSNPSSNLRQSHQRHPTSNSVGPRSVVVSPALGSFHAPYASNSPGASSSRPHGSPEKWLQSRHSRHLNEEKHEHYDEWEDQSLTTQVREHGASHNKSYLSLKSLDSSNGHLGALVGSVSSASPAHSPTMQRPPMPLYDWAASLSDTDLPYVVDGTEPPLDCHGDGDGDGPATKTNGINRDDESLSSSSSLSDLDNLFDLERLDQKKRNKRHKQRLVGPPLTAKYAQRVVGQPQAYSDAQMLGPFSPLPVERDAMSMQWPSAQQPRAGQENDDDVDVGEEVHPDEARAVLKEVRQRHQRAHPRFSVTHSGRLFDSPAPFALHASHSTPNTFFLSHTHVLHRHRSVEPSEAAALFHSSSSNGGVRPGPRASQVSQFRYRKYAGRARERDKLLRRHTQSAAGARYSSGPRTHHHLRASAPLQTPMDPERHFAPGERALISNVGHALPSSISGRDSRGVGSGDVCYDADVDETHAAAMAQSPEWRAPGHVLHLEAHRSRLGGYEAGSDTGGDSAGASRRQRHAKSRHAPPHQFLQGRHLSRAGAASSTTSAAFAAAPGILTGNAHSSPGTSSAAHSRLLEEEQIMAILGLL